MLEGVCMKTKEKQNHERECSLKYQRGTSVIPDAEVLHNLPHIISCVTAEKHAYDWISVGTMVYIRLPPPQGTAIQGVPITGLLLFFGKHNPPQTETHPYRHRQ